MDYRSIHVESSLIVDGGRKEKMGIEFDITFPKIPCYSKDPFYNAFLHFFCVSDNILVCTFLWHLAKS